MYKQAVKHSFKLFSEDIRDDKIASVILMYGEEQYLIKWAVDTMVKKYVNPASLPMDYVVLDETSVSCGDVIEACETFSMFSEKRIVWVKDFKPLSGDGQKGYGKEETERLIQYVCGSNERTVLVFSSEEIKASAKLTAALKKVGAVYNFTKIDRGELTSFAYKRFKKADIEIGARAMNTLIDATGYFNRDSDYRLYNFANDIEKVIAHSSGGSVTEEDILTAVSGDIETFVFDMLDGISAGQKDKAFMMLNNILRSGSDPYAIIAVIVSQFELMLSVKQLRDDGMSLPQIHKKLGGSEYRIKKLIPHANRYSADKLKKTLSDIYRVDGNIKSGLLDAQTALELFIANI